MSEEAIQKYIDTIEDLKEEVELDKPMILKAINLPNLRVNPREYLKTIAMDYYESQTNVQKKAIDAGEKKAKQVLKKYVKS